MGQTFTRVNRSKKDSEVVDFRKSINERQTKNYNKHRNSVYDMAYSNTEYIDDDFTEIEEYEHS